MSEVAEPVTITMLGEPVPFARTRPGHGTGILFTPKKQRNAGAAFRVLAQQAMANRTMFDCALRVEILAEFPIPISWSKKRQAAALLHGTWPAKKPDWDNCAKLVTDACNQIVWRDDALIVDCWVRKTYSDQPKITLTAYAMEAIVQTPFESAQRV